MTLIFNDTLCVLLLQTVSATTHFMPQSASCSSTCVMSLHHVSHVCTQRGLSLLHISTTCPLVVCANQFFVPYLSLKTQKIPMQSKATKKDKKTAPGLKRAYRNTARIGQEVVLKKIVLKEGICRGGRAFI